MNRSRIKWIDDAKGFAAIMVIIGHIVNSHIKSASFLPKQGLMQAVYDFIYMFHMPLFMMLSGFMLYKAYCINREEKKKNYTLQVINIAWLYFVFAFALWVAKTLFASSVAVNVGLIDLWQIPIKPIDETWYLYVLFFLYIICYIIEKLNVKEEIKLGVLLLVCIIAEFIPLHKASPWYKLLHYAFFFYVGIYLAKKPDGMIVKKHARWAYYIGTLVIIVLFFIVGDMARIRVVNIAVAFIMSMAVMCFFMEKENKRESLNGISKVIYNGFNYMGRYALEVYLLHTYIVTIFRAVLPKIGVTGFIPNMLISFLGCVLIPIWIVIILKKIKLHTLLFRPVAYLKK